MRRLLVSALLLVFAQGCANAYTTTVVMADGTTVEALPRCMTDTSSGEVVWGDGIDDGVERSQVADLRSHAGVEVVIVGAAAMLAGSALIAWYATDNPSSKTTWRLAVGGPTAGIGLINAVVGALIWNSSAGALERTCHPRSRWAQASSSR